ncbi:MAG: hypothetical protein OEM60_11130 [Gammaproteobacteria bacterium]|nr:hypothetical protein [Gammaproteobacteria bacterium]MDH3434404.1 hypothetical protein [Gammaproteobacteria bacterium]
MRVIVISLLLSMFLPRGALAQDAPCTCDRDDLLANIRSAQTIFYGSIQEAKMESGQSDTIKLTLDVRDPIRGKESGPVEVSTTLPHECGVRARLGMHSLYVITNESEPVTRCGGSGSHYYQQGHELYDLHNLVFALITIEYADSDPQVVRSWLNRTFSKNYTRRENMESFFGLIGELDPETIITLTDNEVIYRNIVFVFTDDILIDYFWNERS